MGDSVGDSVRESVWVPCGLPCGIPCGFREGFREGFLVGFRGGFRGGFHICLHRIVLPFTYVEEHGSRERYVPLPILRDPLEPGTRALIRRHYLESARR